MAHDIRTLHSNDFGYIGTCNSCGDIHIELGSLMTVVDQNSFTEIVEDFKKKKEVLKFILVQTPNGKKKTIIQVTNQIYLSITRSEYQKCLDLFEMSEHLLEAYNIIRS